MGSREVEPRLQELWDKGISVYSFSKLGTINECLYEAYLQYHKKMRGKDNCYSILGTHIHDKLQDLMENKCEVEDLASSITEGLDDMDTLGIDFPKDRNGGDTIKQGWIKDMVHFCNNYTKPKGNFNMEKFFLYKTPKGNYLQGYIDLERIHDDGETIDIYDYKTSSMFKGEDIKHKGRQLVIYALAEEQQGKKVRQIAWIMLKYAEARFLGKKTVRSVNETVISKVVERKNLIKDLEKHIVYKLEKLGKEDFEIEMIMENAKETNEIPKEVADEFKILPYVMKYDLTDEIRQECIDYIDNTIELWESLDKSSDKDFPPMPFTRIQKNGKEVEDTFFCNTLCGHDCKYIKDFNNTREMRKNNNSNEDEDLFG